MLLEPSKLISNNPIGKPSQFSSNFVCNSLVETLYSLILTEIYRNELEVIIERIKDANWGFTREVCLEMGNIKKLTPEISMIAEKFMMILDQKEKNWKMFQVFQNSELNIKMSYNRQPQRTTNL